MVVFVSCFNLLCKIEVKEVEDGDMLCLGVVYLVLGGK